MRLNRALLLPVSLALLTVCIGGPLPAERRLQRKQAQARLAAFESAGLVIGEYALAPKAIVDGDTIRVEGVSQSLRLLAIDTEETFKSDTDRRLYEQGWEAYLKAKRGDSPRPVKMATPLGEDAKAFADAFFADVEVVRLERDHPKEIRDFYNRYLTYVLAQKGGVWLNFNVECVRAGMSPYFTKYGYSRRFHEEFIAAQNEARAARRGIWDPTRQHYPDYDVRLKWWNARGEFLRRFEQQAVGREHWVILTNWDSMSRLEKLEGQEVVVLGAVGEIRLGDRGPTKVLLSRRMHSNLPLIFFDKDVFLGSGVAGMKGEFVKARGVVTRYRNPRSKRDELQIVVNMPSQIEGSGTVEPGSSASAASQ